MVLIGAVWIIFVSLQSLKPTKKMNKFTKAIAAILFIGIIVTFVECDGNRENGRINDHAYVDLGLPSGTLWATCNMGAGSPEDYGGYYILGQDIKKHLYEYYKDGDAEKYYKCNELNHLIEVFGVGETVDWNSDWHLPRREDFEELMTICSCEKIEMKGVSGCLFVAPNGNSLFLPSAGYCEEGIIYGLGEMNYYRISPISESNFNAWITDAKNIGGFGSGFQDFGLSVRPVCSSK